MGWWKWGMMGHTALGVCMCVCLDACSVCVWCLIPHISMVFVCFVTTLVTKREMILYIFSQLSFRYLYNCVIVQILVTVDKFLISEYLLLSVPSLPLNVSHHIYDVLAIHQWTPQIICWLINNATAPHCICHLLIIPSDQPNYPVMKHISSPVQLMPDIKWDRRIKDFYTEWTQKESSVYMLLLPLPKLQCHLK